MAHISREVENYKTLGSTVSYFQQDVLHEYLQNDNEGIFHKRAKENTRSVVKKTCSHCHRSKNIDKFCRIRGNNQSREFKVCNRCSERDKLKCKAKNQISRRPSHRETNAGDMCITWSICGAENKEVLSEIGSCVEIVLHPEDGDRCKSVDGICIGLDEVREFVERRFKEVETLGEPTVFAFHIHLESILIEDAGLGDESLSRSHDLQTIKNRFKQVIKVLMVPFDAGSGYYWLLLKLNLNTRNKAFSGVATAHLGCAQRHDLCWERPKNRSVQRRSEARSAIERHVCRGLITLKIDPRIRRVRIQVRHLLAHPHPKYRESEFPVVARQWILANKTYDMPTTERYQKLCNLGYIDPKVHTKEQVYYWMAEYSKENYILDSGSRLSSTKAFIERPDVIEKGFKLLFYRQNDFVQALGFLTPLLQKIGTSKINEVLIDSTFGTNQERFELFVVNANCFGCGMPVAYLYVSASNGVEEVCHDTPAFIKTRTEVLREFFGSLRQEGLLPAFILLNKDSDLISAANEAWSRTANLQIGYWHVESAVMKRLKETPSLIDTRIAASTIQAHQMFSFVDPKWTPSKHTSTFCPDNVVNEVLNTLKKHAKMHPLIPVAKETFLSSKEIYQACVEEMYKVCRVHDLCRLWGYLWTNWYNPNDWKLFACSAYPAAVPLARAPAICEDHWRVGLLKYICKYNYTRPRLERLTQILVEQVVPEFQLGFDRYVAGRSFPSWWEEFLKDWSVLAATAIQPGMDECYHIDVSSWVCSCSTFLRHPYFLCEHLVFSKLVTKQFRPSFSKTTPRHDLPLLTLGVRAMPTLSPENSPWSRPVASGAASNPSEDETSGYHGLRSDLQNLADCGQLTDTDLTLYDWEIDKDLLVDDFDCPMRPFMKAVDECGISEMSLGDV